MSHENKPLVFLSGGTGTPKLLLGIRKLIPEERIVVIGNTGDDDAFYGLLVSPDIDTLLYLFSDTLDLTKFWGIKGDSFVTHKKLLELQEEGWFQLGDKDLATHLLRNKLLKQGYPLSDICAILMKKMHIQAKIIPMSNDPVRTIMINTTGRKLSFQEYTVKYQEQDEIQEVLYSGSETAKATKEALEAILNAQAVVIGPSNPITSIGPILAIKGFREALLATTAKKIAISPLEKGRAFSGPAAKLMQELGEQASAVGIAKRYQEFLDIFIIGKNDCDSKSDITALGIKTIETDISLKTEEEQIKLAEVVLQAASN
jgi:LPPG:FO 2-phospho-L-lactate transferase